VGVPSTTTTLPSTQKITSRTPVKLGESSISIKPFSSIKKPQPIQTIPFRLLPASPARAITSLAEKFFGSPTKSPLPITQKSPIEKHSIPFTGVTVEKTGEKLISTPSTVTIEKNLPIINLERESPFKTPRNVSIEMPFFYSVTAP
jgi:hypothetical protein